MSAPVRVGDRVVEVHETVLCHLPGAPVRPPRRGVVIEVLGEVGYLVRWDEAEVFAGDFTAREPFAPASYVRAEVGS